MTEQHIRDCLPVPPFRYRYEVTQQSPQVWRVDLVHPDVYSHHIGHRRTVWGFVKAGKVYPPANYLKARRTPLCDLTDVPDDCDYTTIVPTTRSLLHLQ